MSILTIQVNREDADASGAGEAEVKAKSSSRKEKSVLQSKLTRLAIQIGYAGKDNT